VSHHKSANEYKHEDDGKKNNEPRESSVSGLAEDIEKPCPEHDVQCFTEEDS